MMANTKVMGRISVLRACGGEPLSGDRGAVVEVSFSTYTATLIPLKQ
jgi:hypothetical protein